MYVLSIMDKVETDSMTFQLLRFTDTDSESVKYIAKVFDYTEAFEISKLFEQYGFNNPRFDDYMINYFHKEVEKVLKKYD